MGEGASTHLHYPTFHGSAWVCLKTTMGSRVPNLTQTLPPPVPTNSTQYLAGDKGTSNHKPRLSIRALITAPLASLPEPFPDPLTQLQ